MRPLASLVAIGACVAAAHAEIGDQIAKLTPTDGASGHRFGYAVAVDGATAVIGADQSGVGTGAAYVFDITTGTPIRTLVPANPTICIRFGYSVAISGNIAIVGAQPNPDGADLTEAAYLFDVATGTQLYKLTALDGAAGDYFGASVGISGTTAVVGAHSDDDNGSGSGSVYLFDTTSGVQFDKLIAPDGGAGMQFGRAVAIDGNNIVIGAPGDNDNGDDSGSVYLFSATTGTMQVKISPVIGEPDDQFGDAVAIDGDTLVAGAFADNDNGSYSGCAYLFDVPSGAHIATLRAADGEAYDYFGGAVDLDAGLVVIGARSDDVNGAGSGSAYLFDTAGHQRTKLVTDDGAAGDQYGFAVAISGGSAIVGAYADDDNGSASGAVYRHFAGSIACSFADVTTQGAGPEDPGYGVPDGQVTGADIQYYVNLWVAGCP